MKPVVSIIMGSTSDLPIMEKAAKVLDEFAIPFEMMRLLSSKTFLNSSENISSTIPPESQPRVTISASSSRPASCASLTKSMPCSWKR